MKNLVIQREFFLYILNCNLKIRLTALFLIVSMFQIHANDAAANTSTITQTKFQVSGTVLDANGIPLPGANVIEKGTNNGTTADFDGNYSITLSSQNAIIEVSFIGYTTKDIQVNGQSQIQVVLAENLSQLDEVVVVGYGTQTKATLVGSVTQAKGEELLRAGSVATVSEALAGLMPGVSTQQAAGQPGSTQSEILIRGRSTFSSAGNQPLYIVDGVERDFNDLDPNDIESISVLKDASATAVFGVKAANGVVVVTTKRGLKGETKISFTSSWGIKEPTMDTNYYADYPTTLERYNEAAINSREYGSLVPQSVIDTWRDPNRDKRFYTYTTWINELLTTGKASQYNLNVSGGNDFVKYYTSLGYQFDGDIFDLKEQEDFDPRTYQKKYTWRSNVDFTFSKSTQFNVGLTGNFINLNQNTITQGTNNGIAPGFGDSFSRIWQTPLIGPTPILEDGNLTTFPESVVTPNFYRMERQGQWEKRSSTLYTDFTLIQKLTKTLKVQGRLSYNYSQGYQSIITQNINFYVPNQDQTGFEKENLDATDDPFNVQAESINGSSNSLYYELRLNYDETFGDHKVGALGLVSRRKAQNGTNFPRFEESWVGRATYGYKGKYLAEFNGAYNGSENWAPGLRFGFFPSMAVGWVASKEKFFENNVEAINFLKFRYSYGQLGNDNVPQNERFLYLSPYESNSNGANSFYGSPPNALSPYFVEGTPAILDNTWEVSTKQDLAVEIGAFKNRLQATIELFDEKRENILLQRNTIAPWFGTQRPQANAGKTKNHGIDMELKWNSTIGKDFQYFLRANLSLSESRIVDQDDAPATSIQERNAGKPIGWQSGLISTGINQSWDALYNSPGSSFANDSDLIPGDLGYVDYNGDGQISTLDRVPINNPSFATKTYAFNLGMTYKNFSIHALFNGMFDISKTLANNYLFEWDSANTSEYTSNWQLLNNEQLDAWSSSNPSGTHPALRTTNTNQNSQTSTYSNRSSNFLRLKTMEISYKLGKKAKDAIGIFDSFEIYANGNNLVTWSDLPDEFDPEQRTLQVYPITKRYNFGVRLSF